MNGWMDRWMDGWMDGWMEEKKDGGWERKDGKEWVLEGQQRVSDGIDGCM